MGQYKKTDQKKMPEEIKTVSFSITKNMIKLVQDANRGSFLKRATKSMATNGSKIKTVFWSRKTILKLQQFMLESEIKNLENSSLENLVNKNTNFCSDFCIYSVLAIYLRMPSRIKL